MRQDITLQGSAGDMIRLHPGYEGAGRSSPAEVERQATCFLQVSPLLRKILDAIPDQLLALNSDRQIIFANRSVQSLLRADEAALRGQRAGEALDCIHAGKEPGGCGMSEFCTVCGASQAILASQAGAEAVRECRITRQRSGEALDLRVSARPVEVGDDRFTLLTLTDISHEKRRRALERIFFHDILNTATAMRASADILVRKSPQEPPELPATMQQLTERLIDEITLQRELTDAEENELQVMPGPVNASALMRNLAGSFAAYCAAHEHEIVLALPEQEIIFISDPRLVRRVVGNMLKNALEASRPGERVTVGYTAGPESLEFFVHNPAFIPRPVRLQIFQRSFTTKGLGRGLGTYSMKLLSERYLRGRVWFTSELDKGTTFYTHYPLVWRNA